MNLKSKHSDLKKKDYTEGDDLLIMESISKNYGKIQALDDLSFNARSGEILVILGPSGAGKTTTLKTINGLEPITSGKIIFNGRIINNLEPKERNMAMVFETYALYPHLSVFENIASSLFALRMDKNLIRERVEKISKTLGIFPFLKRKPANLSGGQRQRVALGRALAKPADLYLMDEPIAHLDAKLRHQMIGEFKHLQEELKISIIYVTHDWQEAMSLGNNILVLNNGKLEQYGTAEEIFNSPGNTFVAQLVGDPSMNLIPVELSRDSKGTFIKLGDTEIRLEESINPMKAVLGIRPSRLKLVPRNSMGSIKTVIYSIEKSGMDTIVSLEFSSGIYKTRFKGKKAFTINKEEWVQLDLSEACIFDQENKLIQVLGRRNG